MFWLAAPIPRAASVFVDSSLAASTDSIAATQVLCCNYCVHWSRPEVSLWKFFSPPGHYKELNSGWSRVEWTREYSALQCCFSWYCWGMFGDWVLPNRAHRVVHKIICAWVILFCIWTHSEAGASWWWLARQLLTLWSLMHNPEILVHMTYAIIPLWILSMEHLWFYKNCCISCKVHYLNCL